MDHQLDSIYDHETDQIQIKLPNTTNRPQNIDKNKQRVVIIISFLILALFIFITGLIILLIVFVNIIPNSPPPKVTLVQGRTGAVAADNPTCSQTGVDILKAGGNAVDAVIATCLCTGVMNPWSSGIGGGGILVVSDVSGKVNTIDFRETAPQNSFKDMFMNKTRAAQKGGLAIATPAELKGLYTAWNLYGNLPWASLVQPAITLAQSHPAQQLLVDHLKLFEQDILSDKYGSGMRTIYAPQGRLVQVGETVSNPALANTLRIVAEKGVDSAMYTDGSPLIDQIVDDVISAGGILTKEDLLQYQVKVAPPVSSYYRGYKIFGARPEISGGLCVSLALNILEQYKMGQLERDSYQVNHYLIEAMKFAFGHRMSLGDENFLNLTTIMKAMVDKDYAGALRLILPEIGTLSNLQLYLFNESLYDRTKSSNARLMYPWSDHGTSHMTAVDSNRMAASLTTTINLFFGSMVLSEKTGILYNDQMDDFSIPNATNAFNLPPTENNFIVPGKRPLSSMTPTIVHKNGKFYMGLGASGGTYITTATLQTLINVLDFGMDIASAIQYPRFHHQLIPDLLDVENQFNVDTLSKILYYDKYNVDIMTGVQENLGVVQGVVDNDGILQAASDSRKKSIAVAY
jgi:gamma-glutamyltranspeptidase/glutathione hydrolase/leukotriene-C4 hydrolase